MNKTLQALFLLSSLILVKLGAQPVLISGDSPAVVVYDNVTKTPTWVIGTITLTKNQSNVTDITVDLSPKADSPYPRNSNWVFIGTSSDSPKYIDNFEVFFNQSTSGNIIKMWGSDSSVTSSNVYSYTFPSGSAIGTTTSFQYYTVFWHDSSLTEGTYQIPITFRVRNESFKKFRLPKTDPVDTQLIYIKYVVNPSATIDFLSGSSGDTKISSISFNDVVTSTTSTFRASITSNFRYSLSVSSATEHGGELKHVNPEVIETIPYTFSIGGSTVTVSSTPYFVASMERPTGTGTREYLASITIGDIQNYTAGKYSDFISFAVTAN
jgi:hypothetical protein